MIIVIQCRAVMIIVIQCRAVMIIVIKCRAVMIMINVTIIPPYLFKQLMDLGSVDLGVDLRVDLGT